MFTAVSEFFTKCKNGILGFSPAAFSEALEKDFQALKDRLAASEQLLVTLAPAITVAAKLIPGVAGTIPAEIQAVIDADAKLNAYLASIPVPPIAAPTPAPAPVPVPTPAPVPVTPAPASTK